MFERISRDKCKRLLTEHQSVFLGRLLPKDGVAHQNDEIDCMVDRQAFADGLELMEHRTATRKSYGVVFSGGSELRFDKGDECYLGKICGYPLIQFRIVDDGDDSSRSWHVDKGFVHTELYYVVL